MRGDIGNDRLRWQRQGFGRPRLQCKGRYERSGRG